MNDEQLIKASLEGSEHAFKELVKRYESLVAATVIGMLGKCPEAEDVGQETFIRFYQGLKNFRGESKVSTYITRIAINLSLDELKKRQKKSLFFWQNQIKNDKEDYFANIPDENNKQAYEGEKEVIQLALQQLESKFRTVIVLRLLDGYSTEETAQILQVPPGTVLSRLARAQKKLKILLSPYYKETE